MRFLALTASIALACLPMAGCGAPPAAQAPHMAQEKPQAKAPRPQEKRLRLVVADGGAAPANDWDLRVALGVIPGALTGSPIEPWVKIPASFGQEFSISLHALEQVFAAHARPAQPALVAAGLVVEPQETRYLRVATFLYDEKKKRLVMGGGFASSASDGVILTYFDRACAMTGIISSHGFVSDIQIQVPAAGFYWLRADMTGEATSRYRSEQAGFEFQFRAM